MPVRRVLSGNAHVCVAFVLFSGLGPELPACLLAEVVTSPATPRVQSTLPVT